MLGPANDAVPNGGYVAAVILGAVRAHFDTTLKKLDQPHPLAMQLQFLRRTESGPGQIVIKDVKTGRQASVVHVTLYQGNREEVVGYITQTNMPKEIGISFPTAFSLHPPVQPFNFKKAESNHDVHWSRIEKVPFQEFRPAVLKLEYFIPRAGFTHPSVVDQWCRFASGEKFTTKSLGFLADMFPLIIENYYDNAPQAAGYGQNAVPKHKEFFIGKFWYPTILMNLDVKKALPEEGVEWLFVRAASKAIKNGRFDYDVTIMDTEGDLVALSSQAAYAVDVSRNVATRVTGKDSSKM